MSQPVFNYRCRKVGGIWFLRLGRLQFSFCLCRHRAITEVQHMGMPASTPWREVQHVTYQAGSTMVAHAE